MSLAAGFLEPRQLPVRWAGSKAATRVMRSSLVTPTPRRLCRHSYGNAAVAPAHTSGGKTPKLDPLLGLHFRNVLGDALRAERGLARRVSRLRLRVSET